MAQFINVTNSGLLKLPTTANTSTAGNVWFDTVAQRVKYSYNASGTILSRNLGE